MTDLHNGCYLVILNKLIPKLMKTQTWHKVPLQVWQVASHQCSVRGYEYILMKTVFLSSRIFSSYSTSDFPGNV